MKTRTILPLFCALSFFMVAVTSSSAQTPLAPLTPIDLRFTIDTAFLTYDLGQTVIQSRTISGSIQNMDPFSADVKVNIQTSKQWVVQTKINGVIMQGGEAIDLSGNQTVPVEITLVPYAEGPDTERYCVSLMYGTQAVSGECITLAVTKNQSGVTADLPAPTVTISPNPAGSYISLGGLSGAAAEYSYEIFSISGAEIRHGLLPADARIGVQDLSSGAYRLLLFDGKRTLANSAITILH